MSDAKTNEANKQVLRDALRKLVDEDRGRKESRKSDREPFVNAWVNLVTATGIDDEAVDYLFDGIRIAEAEPLYRYASVSSAVIAYRGFIKTPRASKNEGGCTLRILLNLLALELLSPTSPNPLDFISRKLVEASTNKKGKQFGNLPQLTRRVLVHPLVGKSISSEAEIQQLSARTLLGILRTPLEKMANAHNVRDGDAKAIGNLLEWLNLHVNHQSTQAASQEEPSVKASDQDEAKADGDTMEQVTSDNGEPTSTQELEQPQESKAPQDTSTDIESDDVKSDDSRDESAQPVREQQKSRPVPKKKGASKSLSIDEVIAFLTAFQSEQETLKQQLEKVRKVKSEADEEIHKLRSLLKTVQREVDEERGQRMALSGNYTELRQRYEEAQEENASLKNNLAEAEEMLIMLEEHNAHATDVANQKMVNELRFEYEQYRGAADAPMDTDLGEIMRDELGKVFDILKENGIDL